MDEMTYAFPKIKEIAPSIYIDAYALIAGCSQARSPRTFVTRFLALLKKACPYDEAMAFFINANGRVFDKYTIGIKPERLDTYLEYYMELAAVESPEYNLNVSPKESSGMSFSQIIDWSTFPDSTFKREYIVPHGLKHTWGFCFFDVLGTSRVVFSLDRLRNDPYSETERSRLGLALPILNNMYRNFFYQGTEMEGPADTAPWAKYKLTAREQEIALLLCQGMTTHTISASLCISVTTTYKHISNIFRKVGVTSQQELIAKLLNQKTP